MTENAGGGITISGPENMRKFQVLQVIHGLSLEIMTGMKLSNRGSALDAARIHGIIAGRATRKVALEAAVAKMKELDPEYEPRASVKRALDK